LVLRLRGGGKKGPGGGQTKEAKAKAAMAKKGGKKKKWAKGKSRDLLNNQVLMDKETEEKLMKEVPTYKLITTSVVSDRMKVNGSLARRLMRMLEEKGLIKYVAARRAAPPLLYCRYISLCRPRMQLKTPPSLSVSLTTTTPRRPPTPPTMV